MTRSTTRGLEEGSNAAERQNERDPESGVRTPGRGQPVEEASTGLEPAREEYQVELSVRRDKGAAMIKKKRREEDEPQVERGNERNLNLEGRRTKSGTVSRKEEELKLSSSKTRVTTEDGETRIQLRHQRKEEQQKKED